MVAFPRRQRLLLISACCYLAPLVIQRSVLGSQHPISRTFCSTGLGMLSPKSVQACADVYLVKMFTDNYGYIVVDRETKLAAVVDPGEPQPIIDALSTLSCSLSHVLCTHKHADHAGGNEMIKATFPNIEVIATKYEPIPSVTKPVGEGDHFRLGSLDINVIYTPCHTRGHVIFIVSGPSGKPIIFTGDTLFVGGTGRFFEGTADEMLTNMDRLATYTPESLVYPAHEYTESNFKFLSHVDPETCSERYKLIQKIRADGQPTVPSSIGEEIEFNLFMQTRRDRLMKILDRPTPVEAMAKLRQMKNNF